MQNDFKQTTRHWFVRTLLNNGRNLWHCLGIIFSRGCALRSFLSTALTTSYIQAVKIWSFPFLTIRKNADRLSITKFPWNCRCGCISGWNFDSSEGWTNSGCSSITPWTVTAESGSCVVQHCGPNVTVFDANCTATWCNYSQGIARTIR